MKRFLRYSLLVLVFTALSCYLLDYAYSAVYANCRPRNKFQYILKATPTEYDYVFLGSSRVANHIIPSVIEEKTGKKAINLGIEGAELEDSLLQLKLMLSQGFRIRKLFLQVDYLYNSENTSIIAGTAALPFIKNPIIEDHLKGKIADFEENRYVPFYRYMKKGHAIGFREFSMSLAGKAARFDMADGFVPLEGRHPLSVWKSPDTLAAKNKSISEFFSICATNNIELVLFYAPSCSLAQDQKFLRLLKARLPELQDYSRAIPDSLFQNCGHLNKEGARAFTLLFIEKELAKDSRESEN